MSKVAIQGDASGTGTFTLASPNSNSDRTLTLPDTSGTVMTDSGTQTANFSALTVNSNNISATNSLGFRNRIINGDMRIDQRNAGASASLSASLAYFLDRWNAIKQTGSAGTVQQSSIAPSTFSYSLLATNNVTGASPSAAQLSRLQHRIEGFNAADLDYGTASAKTTTLSFWVRSSVVGTYGVGLSNSSFDRSYVATYNIDSADTFEYKTITIPGDTTGTWLKTNGMGIALSFDLGSGADANGTADAWQTGFKVRTSGCVNWVATGSATFRITGVQLEAGSTATPFERRAYGTELQLCQRYYEVLPGWADTRNIVNTSNSFPFNTQLQFKVTKRANPTMVAVGATSSFSSLVFGGISVEGCIFGAASGSTGVSSTSFIYVTSGFNASIEL